MADENLLQVTKGIRIELYARSDDIIATSAELCQNLLFGAKHEEYIMRSARNMVQKEGLLSQTSDTLSALEVTVVNMESEVGVIEKRLKELQPTNSDLKDMIAKLSKIAPPK